MMVVISGSADLVLVGFDAFDAESWCWCDGSTVKGRCGHPTNVNKLLA